MSAHDVNSTISQYATHDSVLGSAVEQYWYQKQGLRIVRAGRGVWAQWGRLWPTIADGSVPYRRQLVHDLL